MVKRESSQINIRRAQDSRRVIGVIRFINKLVEYSRNIELWGKIQGEFSKRGLRIEKEKKDESL